MEKKLSIKSTPTGEAITKNHVEKSLRKQKEKRKEMMFSKRTGKQQSSPSPSDGDLKKLISNFPMSEFMQNPKPIDIVTKLAEILRIPDSKYYYDKSNIYPEYDEGPFLFQNKLVLQRLISFLNTSQDMDLLIAVTRALIFVSAHEEAMTWSFEMVRCNFIPFAITLLDKCPNLEIKENIILIFANLMADNVMVRSKILTFERFQQVFVNNLKIHTEHLMDNSAFLFNCALLEEVPLKHIEPIWETMIEYSYNCPEGDVLRVLICGITRGVTMDCDDYRLNVAANDRLLEALMKPKTQDESMLRMIANIMSALMATPSLHEKLITKGILGLYHIFLNHKELVVRREGCNGVYNAIVNGSGPSVIEHSALMVSIERQFIISEDNKIWEKVRLIMFQLMLNYSLPKWEKYVYEVICNNYIHSTNPLQLFLALRVLAKMLSRNNCKVIHEKMEETDALTYLEQISMNNTNNDVRELAEKIVRKFDSEDMDVGDD